MLVGMVRVKHGGLVNDRRGESRGSGCDVPAVPLWLLSGSQSIFNLR